MHPLTQLAKAVWSFLRENYAFVSACSTVVIATYAVISSQVEQQLRDISVNQLAMQTEPVLSGDFGRHVNDTDPPCFSHFRITNTGSDTAWAVFVDLRALVLCDTVLIYDWGYLYGAIASIVIRGDFGRVHPIAPAEVKKLCCSDVSKRVQELALILDGAVLIQADYVYWSSSPTRKLIASEFFLYNGRTGFQNEALEKLASNDVFVRRLNDLVEHREIAKVDFTSLEDIKLQGSGTPLVAEFTLVLSNRISHYTPWRSNEIQWDFKDTSIVVEGELMPLNPFRQRLPEFREYEAKHQKWVERFMRDKSQLPK